MEGEYKHSSIQKVQNKEYLIKNACYSVTKYYLCKQNNKRSLLGRKQRSQVAHSFPNRYQFGCTNKVTSLFSIRYILIIILACKSMVFALQKYGFWRAKTTFLAYKNHLFDLQKVGFCIFVKYISIFIDINKENERTYNKFIKMVYNSLKRQSCHCVLYIFYI